MREGMIKPMILLSFVLLVLGSVFAWWITSGPSRAEGARPAVRAHQQRQVDRIIREIENQN
ncbi:MAG TPA: hypothetical protein VFJ30_01705 [Phycisphaerae bacterium]|nr:hypothetical protein [Phycisphaerae bacterium]